MTRMQSVLTTMETTPVGVKKVKMYFTLKRWELAVVDPGFPRRGGKRQHVGFGQKTYYL